MSSLRLRVEGRRFRDGRGREVTLRGINCAGDAKFPARPDVPSYRKEDFFDGDKVSFVGRPFSLDEAHEHFSRLKGWGYNAIRYIFTWEALEHAGPGRYDDEFVQHTIETLRLAKQYGFYVWMDPHQDVWSRFTGGSGAPLWTLYAAGLDPHNFAATQAALVHNTWPDPAHYPSMIWATNYTRLACQTLFTLFFAGRDFAPKAIIDGVNIQDYLQSHFVDTCGYLAKKIVDAGLDQDVVVGWESMNEPHRGLVGWQDITVIPSDQKLQKGPSPTVWQAILTGSGRACEEDTWEFGGLGPYKSGSELVDPKDTSAWLPVDYDDSRYGWKRDAQWRLGECIWAQHGVWNPETDEVQRKDYFAKDRNGQRIDYEYFTNHYFMPYYRKHRAAIVAAQPEAILLCQAPVLEIPPSIKGTADDDPNMVFAPHYYDGITLITKKWNRYWNVDVFGLLRGRYLAPAFAVKIGESAIRKCFRDQLDAIRKEGLEYMGEHPCIFTEIGIPYDMDDRYAYRTGDFSSQSSAMDANHFALEASGANGFALWLYMCTNRHEYGDLWNGEDLSIYSLDDCTLPQSSDPLLSDVTIASALDQDGKTMRKKSDASSKRPQTTKGCRAGEAHVRPSPIATVGCIKDYGFDLRNCIFNLELESSTEATDDCPTEIFLPGHHFPREQIEVHVSSGSWCLSLDDANGGLVQRLRWVHHHGQQTIRVQGVRRRQGIALGKDEDESYFERWRQIGCSIM